MGITYEQLREWALALPGTQEVFVEGWGHPTLRYGDKMFAAGSPESSHASVKASLEEQAELIAGAPDVYEVAAYTGRYGWVRVDLTKADARELRQVVTEAWRRTAPKRVVKAYDSAQG
ncbi:MmcQ/YjbR family DNA-binding protein [Actinoplanes sp. CA-142083]|uniref:MmcQ/YjbR family DNA-binding protein n=1 Tax=Actinoplanes sp. CA-142083 TaxID=3239903 RepID=UPI003D8F5791